MSGKRFRAWAGAGLLALGVGVGELVLASRPDSSIPAIIVGGTAHGARAVWVAASAASADGALRLGLFEAGSRRNLEEQVRSITASRKGRPAPHVAANNLLPAMERAPYLSEELCESSSIVIESPEVPRDSFEALHRHARDIVGGRIIDIEQGFVNGLPSSLFEVEIDSVLRSSGDFAASRLLYVVYPYAVFRIGDTTFCRREPAYSYRPQIDDRVFLFPASAPIDEHDLLVWPQPEEVVAEKPGGGLMVAKSLQEQMPFAEIETLDELIKRLPVAPGRSEGGS